MKRYFIAAGLNEQSEQQNAQMNAIAQGLMRGKASKWLDRLERQGMAPTVFAEFSTKFLEQFSVIDDKNMAQDKLWMA